MVSGIVLAIITRMDTVPILLANSWAHFKTKVEEKKPSVVHAQLMFVSDDGRTDLVSSMCRYNTVVHTYHLRLVK